jgi:small subunit ribosomal protein S16
MLSIRLTRVGKKKDASFRVVVIDSKRKIQAGNYLEMVGSYDPRVDTVSFKADRVKHWISQGARPSDTVHNLLITQGIIEGKKINVLPKKVLAKPEEPAPAAEAAPAATVAETTPEKVEDAPEVAAEAPAEAAADAGATADSSANTADAGASAGGDAGASA